MDSGVLLPGDHTEGAAPGALQHFRLAVSVGAARRL